MMTLTRRIGIWLALALLTGLVAAANAATPSDLEQVLAELEGGWYGEGNTTPLGPMAFVLLFDRQQDGSLLARTSLNRETYVELEFERDEAGRWMLREEAGMEGLGVQSYTLAPLGLVDSRYRWVSADNPGYLWVDLAAGEDAMTLDVTLRGERHVLFELTRMAADEVSQARAQLELQASQSPAEGHSITDLVAARSESADGPPQRPVEDEAIAAARAAVAEQPDDGRAHLRLAQALGAAIQRDPANGPLYGYEMLAGLQRAIELDPRLAEAYHWLVGYYLNAPPIAGGSVEKAAETARRLAEFDPAGAEELLREIEAHGGGR